MKFLPLLDLSIKHSYYADSRCPDFLLAAAPETCRLLRNLRGIVKSRMDGIGVIVPIDESQSLPFIPPPKDAVFTFQLSLRNPGFTLFTDPAAITTHADNTAATCQWRYPGKSERRKELFGLVDITAPFSQLSENPLAFSIEFIAKQSRWSYYFITDINPNGGEFTIVDADPTGSPVTFANDNRTALDLQPDPNDPVAALLTRQYPDNRRWRFVSTSPVACRQRPRDQLQLRLGNSNLMEHLPNPSVRNYSRIDVAGNLQDTFYQIVKYISDPSLTRV